MRRLEDEIRPAGTSRNSLCHPLTHPNNKSMSSDLTVVVRPFRDPPPTTTACSQEKANATSPPPSTLSASAANHHRPQLAEEANTAPSPLLSLSPPRFLSRFRHQHHLFQSGEDAKYTSLLPLSIDGISVCFAANHHPLLVSASGANHHRLRRR